MMTIIPARVEGIYGSAPLAIVDLGASWTVVDRRKSLWTVPELWKTHNTRFPQLVGRRTARAAHNGPQAVVFYERRTNA